MKFDAWNSFERYHYFSVAVCFELFSKQKIQYITTLELLILKEEISLKISLLRQGIKYKLSLTITSHVLKSFCAISICVPRSIPKNWNLVCNYFNTSKLFDFIKTDSISRVCVHKIAYLTIQVWSIHTSK